MTDWADELAHEIDRDVYHIEYGERTLDVDELAKLLRERCISRQELQGLHDNAWPVENCRTDFELDQAIGGRQAIRGILGVSRPTDFKPTKEKP